MNTRRLLACAALAAASLATAALALDRLFPPDLSRYHERSSETVDANGRLLRAFTTADGKWRLKTTVDDVDPVYLALLKAYEDRRFDDHWGIDPLAAARAAGQWIERGRIVSGASTISMQAARLLEPRQLQGGQRGLLTKAIQSARALQLEWRYSKREVLAIYLTLAPMGGNLEGVRAASFAYFGKEPRQLSAAEAALLVAIPQSPERRRPERAGKSAQAARDRVLVRGLEHGIIDRVLFDKAASRPVPDRRLAMPMQAPHLAAWLAGQSPGAIIPTTLRFELQSALSQLVAEERGQFADRAQIAVVAIDNRTGSVAAWLGGSDFFGRAGQVDLVRSRRSPGSALKPLIYAMAFDDRVLHPESLVEDVPVRFRDWLPRNFDRDHVGAVTVRRALQQSLNVPAVLALEKVGPQRFLSTLRNAGVVPGLPPGEAGATLGVALGSATVSPLEMAGLYAGLANGGKFAPPAVRRDRPKPEPVHLIGATGASPSRPAPRPASATPGPRATAPTGPSWCGSATPTARRVPVSSAACRPCRSCSRLSAACPPRTIAPSPLPPTCCASPRIMSCRCACAPWGRRRRARAVRASPIHRPTPASSFQPARPCRCRPWAAKVGCAG